MSWLNGNADTSFWNDITSVFKNATTGELSDSQRADIIAANSQWGPCAIDPSSAACVAFKTQIASDVYKAAPSTGCILRLSDSYCIDSWDTVAKWLMWAGIGLIVVYGAIIGFGLYGRVRG